MKRKSLLKAVGAIVLGLLLAGCFGGEKQPKAYSSDLTSSDSISIKMGDYTLVKYYSRLLGFDINYPSFLVHEILPEEAGMQELFMMDDVSISVMVDSLNNMTHSR